ncbi:MAG: EAL domain-containing protein [Gemmatimonadaceae bacterium]
MDPLPETTRTPDRRWYAAAWWLVVIGVLCSAASALLPADWFRPVYVQSSLLFPAFPLAASIRAWRSRRASDPANAWAFIVVGVTGFFIYDLLWYAEAVTGWTLSLPVGDFSNLIFSPLLLVGLVRVMPAPVSQLERRRGSLDAAILALSAAVLLHATVELLGGGIRRMNEWRDLLLLVSPMTDLLTLSALALLWVRRERYALPLWVVSLGAALLIGFVSDVWYAVPASVGRASPWFVSAAWYGSWSAIALGATQATRPTFASQPSGQISRLPYVLALACYVALGIAVTLDRRDAIVSTTIGTGVVTCLVLLRQVVALRELTGLQEERLRHQADERLAALVRHGSDMLTIIGPDMTVLYASPSHETVFGLPPEALVGRQMSSEIHREDLPATERGLQRLLSGVSQRESLVVRIRDAANQWRWIEAVATNRIWEPMIRGLVLNSRDITDRKQLESQLLEQALRDPLTGLANRRLFGDRVSHALARRHRRPDSIAVLLLDLDHFKFVNDSLGHAKGDALLVSVAERLTRALRSADTVARLGGDEFAVLLEDLQRGDEADATAVRIQQALSRPFVLDDREVSVRASIGIAWASEGQTVDDLLTEADVAMYGAKNSGRGCIERFSTQMRANVAERHDVEASLRRALEHDEFDVLYQPVVDLESGRIVGAEALVRWQHPGRGVIMPARFISVAEESDLIVAIGRIVLRRAAGDARRFRAASPTTANMRVAVNLSARQLLAPDLISDVTSAMRTAGITGDALAIELTESVLASSEGVVASRLQALRDLGLRVALDDFGTGYSALAYLRRFPIDVLKVDKSFISWVRDNGTNDGVTKAIIAMGHSLSMRTVAEGVETTDQLAWLRSLGCNLGQGYLFSLPLPGDDFVTLLRGWDETQFGTRAAAAISAHA